MDSLIYIGKSAALLSLFFLVYEFLLKKETLFDQNRIFLLLGLLTSIFLPGIVFKKTVFIDSQPLSLSGRSGISPPSLSGNLTSQSLSFWESLSLEDVLLFIYCAGVLVLLIRFLFRLAKLMLKLHKHPVSFKTSGINLIETREDIGAFSFFKTIVFNPNLYSRDELPLILKHEKAHARNYHNLDIILSELIKIGLWFNPLVWLYNKRIHQNLEYLADREATKNIDSPQDYQHSLVKSSVVLPEKLPIINFHQSFIKTRILMLNKRKSPRKNTFKALLILPFLVLFCLGFQVKTVAQVKPGTQKTPVSFQGINLSTHYQGGKLEQINLLVRKFAKQKSLKKLEDLLAEKYNIHLSFDNLETNQEGNITRLKMHVRFKDGFEGTTSTSSSEGIAPLYFNRVYKNTKVPFEIGTKTDYVGDSKILHLVKQAGYFILNGEKISIEEAQGSFFKIKSAKVLDKNNPSLLSVKGTKQPIKNTITSPKNGRLFLIDKQKNILVMSDAGGIGFFSTKELKKTLHGEEKIIQDKKRLKKRKAQRKKLKEIRKEALAKRKEARKQRKKALEQRRKTQHKRQKLKRKREKVLAKRKEVRQQRKKVLKERRKTLKNQKTKRQDKMTQLKNSNYQLKVRFSKPFSVTVTAKTTTENLEKIKHFFSTKGLQFSFDDLERNEEGEITAITLRLIKENEQGLKFSHVSSDGETIPKIEIGQRQDGEIFIESVGY